MTDTQKREHYQERGYKPFLFYVVFGTSGKDLEVSASRHHADGLPAGLSMQALSRKDNAAYIEGFFAGAVGNILKGTAPELYEKCKNTDDCVILKGEVEEHRTLDYMRNVIGILQALLEQGGVGVLDLMTFTLYSPEDFKERFFEKEVNAQNHAFILASKEKEGYWLHTRGMAAFGRPDYSLHVSEEDPFEEYKDILDQMIYYGGQGVFFDGEYRLHTHSGKTYRVSARYVEDFNNDDFNNAYSEVTLAEEEEAAPQEVIH
ncbi:MAG: hypothetical protein IJJ30_04750 [Erysipelotrichaceae bacterium]|nr:hypothetical protein [Erysipelotrichaceae bacterium]